MNALTGQSTNSSRVPQVGDIWEDVSCGYQRYVRVEAVYSETLLIKGAKPVEMKDGRRWILDSRSKCRSTKLTRFAGSKPDFTFMGAGQ